MSSKIVVNSRSKFEKHQRRKKYDDLQVQGTNNSSIVSKRSVEMIYKAVMPEGEWFKYFVTHAKRRSPAINRGYWIRMESIRKMMFRIMATTQGDVNVINLGCGYDPLAFQVLSMLGPALGRPATNTVPASRHVRFYDIDYPELVANKLAKITAAQPIVDLIGGSISAYNDYGMVYESLQYKLLGCDLKDHQLFETQLQLLPPGINIFIAEVSLAYMAHEDADKIIELASRVPNSHFVILEQIIPNGPWDGFSQKMLAHFTKLRSRLKCVEQYPTKQHQIDRFRRFYSKVEIKDLFQNWTELIDTAEKIKIESIEDFDEWEEFIMFCQHYVIAHATNDNLVYTNKDQTFDIIKNSSLQVKLDNTPVMDLRFAAACRRGDDLWVHGGLDQTRSDKLYKNGTLVDIAQGPSPRMCHSFTTLANSHSLLIGGRTRPGKVLKDVYKFDGAWTRLQDLPIGVFRHEVIEISDDEVLIIGGQESTTSNKLIIYNHQQSTYKYLDLEPQTPSGIIDFSTLKSFGVWYWNNQGFIVGGLCDKYQPRFNNKLVHFTISHKFVYSVIEENCVYERINPKIMNIENELVIIGGVNYHQPLNQNNCIISRKNDNIYNVTIPDDIWRNQPPLLIGHSVIDNKILYGGAVCYSFGSVHSFNYCIEK